MMQRFLAVRSGRAREGRLRPPAALLSLVFLTLAFSSVHAQVIIRERLEFDGITAPDSSGPAFSPADSPHTPGALAFLQASGTSGVVDVYVRIKRVSTHYGWEDYGPPLSGNLVITGTDAGGASFEAAIPLNPQVQFSEEYMLQGDCRYWSSGPQLRGHREYAAVSADNWVRVGRVRKAAASGLGVALDYEGKRIESPWGMRRYEASSLYYHVYPRCVTGMVLYVYFDVELRPAPELEIIPPEDGWQDLYISTEPAMPKVELRAVLKNYSGEEEVEFEWTYSIEYELKRYRFRKEPLIMQNLEVLCSRYGTSTIQGHSREVSGDTVYWKVPFDADSAAVKYRGLYWKQRKHYASCSEEVASWPIANGWGGDYRESFAGAGSATNKLFSGGIVSIEVKAKVDDLVLTQRIDSAYTILGTNPSRQTVREALTEPEHRAVVGKESGYLQFNKSSDNERAWKKPYVKAGYPRYGRPNGFGLSQLDNPNASELQLWNWRRNITGGVGLFEYYKAQVIAYLIQQDPRLFSQDSLSVIINAEKVRIAANEFKWKQIFLPYNAGLAARYWKRVKLKEDDSMVLRWVKTGNEFSSYADEAFERYQQELGQ